MGTFYQIQGKSKELIDNSIEGISYFKNKYNNIKPFSIINREYKISLHEKNNNIFKIPLDGHLIKNMYLKADLNMNKKNNNSKINEWKDLKIFDNPNFLNYTITNIPNIENIDIEPITNNLKKIIYEDYYNTKNLSLEVWKKNIINYYHKNENESIIIKNVLNYYDIETNLLETLNNNLIEYKNIKVLYLINFYINILYLFYNNLINLEKIYSNRIVLTENSITSEYLLEDFISQYLFYYENNNINKLYIQQQLDLYINDLRIKLENEKNRQNENSINNISTIDFENNYEIYLNNILLKLNEDIWSEDIINVFSEKNVNIDSSEDNSIGKINQKYSNFLNEILINIYYNLFNLNTTNTNISIIDSSAEYYQIYLNFIKNINTFIISELIIDDKYINFFDLDKDDISDINNINLNNINTLIINDIFDIKNFYYDYKTIISIDISEFKTIQEIKDNLFDLINTYQKYQLNKININLYSTNSTSVNTSSVNDIEFIYIELIEKYDFRSSSEFLFLTVYNNNENILIYFYKNNQEITIQEENRLRELIYNYNLTNDNKYKILIKDEFPLFDLSLFNTYPFYNFEKLIVKERTLFENFKNIIILQSCLNPIFLEEMYHEYVFERKINIKNEYNISVEIEINDIEKKLDDYQKQIIQSYTFYNKEYFINKIPEEILEEINDIHKYKYFHILNYENFIEYTRTNYNYFIYLYNEWNKKLQGIKKWKSLLQIEYKGEIFTYIELKHILEIENNRKLLSENDINSKIDIILNNLNNKYENYLNTKNFEDLDLDNIKVEINYNKNLKMNLKIGKKNFNNIKINRLFLYPKIICILYYEKDYRHIAYIFENKSDSIKYFYVREDIKSIFIYPYNLKSFKYKELDINIEEDFSIVFSNDIYYDFNNNKLIRKFIPEKNFYLYLELYRWSIFNDFYDLITRNYKKKVFEKINLEYQKQYNIFEYINLQIDDQIIETLCDDTLNIYQNYFIKNKKGFNKLLEMNYIPLIFWFMRSKYAILPIISLSNTNVYLNIKFNENIIIQNNIGKIYIDYVLLSPEERNDIIIQDNIYILNSFNQKQLLLNRNNNFLKLPFNSQIIDFFIIFYNQKNEIIEINKYIESLKLKIDGKESVKYYDLKYHTNVTIWNKKYKGFNKNIINISFAINPIILEQPSGSINYSSITDSVLKFLISDITFYKIYKFSKIIFRDYKYLKIISGQASLI